MSAELNLADRMAIRQQVMVPRCTAAVANYALYILGNVNATTEQLAWAREAIRAPASFGEQVSWYVIVEPKFLGAVNGSDWLGGSSIPDDGAGGLKGAVEAAINNHFIQPPPEE